MSRAPYIAPAQRWGARMGDSMLDMMTGALSDPFGRMHMGVTAENVAAKFGISRQDQDTLAAESHRRAAAAIEAGHFRDQIVPVTLKSRKGDIVFDTDEHVRRDVTADSLAGLKPVFQKENGTVTAGNASRPERRRRRGHSDERLGRRQARRQAAGPAGGLRPCRRRSQHHGHRPRAEPRRPRSSAPA